MSLLIFGWGFVGVYLSHKGQNQGIIRWPVTKMFL